MSASPAARAPSGARLLGDDVQHLIVWYYALRSLREDSDIEELAVEAPDVGNLDDLKMLCKGSSPDEYWQIKASVDAATPLDETYLTDIGRNGQSLLQKLYASWLDLSVRGRSVAPRVVLATTKSIDRNDAVLSKRATTDARIHETLRHDDNARKRWAEHLQVGEDELMSFLANFTIRHGQSETEWREKIQDVAANVHVQADRQGIALGLQQVRDWVKAPRQTFRPADLHKVVSSLDLNLPSRTGLVVVEMLEPNARSASATYNLDLISLFDGSDPNSRRQLKDPTDADFILGELATARNELRSKGIYEVEVEGPMRLPLWFLVGNKLGNTAGMSVYARTSGGVWTSAASPADDALMVVSEPGDAQELGKPLAVSLNLANDITADVDDYIVANLAGIPHVRMGLARPGSRGIKNAAHAQAIAFRVRNEMRALDRRLRPSEIHLFLAMPGPAALLIGHVWDRLPSTTTYWDLGRPGAYAPAFTIS